MTVTEVRAAYPKWRRLPPVAAWQAHFWQIAVRVDTDVGVVGHGYGGGGQPAVHVINDHLRRLLVGRALGGVDDIAAAWDELYRVSIPYGRGGLAQMALSGVDLALWDALARAERVPVHRLIGPRTKQRVTAYATGGDLELTARYGYGAMKLSHRWRTEADFDSARRAAGGGAGGAGTRGSPDGRLLPVVAGGGGRPHGRAAGAVRAVLVRGRGDPRAPGRTGRAASADQAGAAGGRRARLHAGCVRGDRPPRCARPVAAGRDPGPGASPARCAFWSWRAVTACRWSRTAAASRGDCT